MLPLAPARGDGWCPLPGSEQTTMLHGNFFFSDLFLLKLKGFRAWQCFPSELSSQTSCAQQGMSPKPGQS